MLELGVARFKVGYQVGIESRTNEMRDILKSTAFRQNGGTLFSDVTHWYVHGTRLVQLYLNIQVYHSQFFEPSLLTCDKSFDNAKK